MMIRLLIFNLLKFLALPMAFMAIALIASEPTPKILVSLLAAKPDKDILLEETASPRLILVGGSNLSFGLNSQMIKDQTGLNPINTGIHAGVGLKYMMDNVLQYVQAGDIIILIPEYHHFFNNFAYGRMELVRTLIEIDSSEIKTLNLQQWLRVVEQLPAMAMIKVKPSSYAVVEGEEFGLHGRYSFNQYGDSELHWPLEPALVQPLTINAREAIDVGIINDIESFQKQVTDKGATLYISFPGFQDSSFDGSYQKIKALENRLRDRGFSVLGTPEQYRMSGAFIFDTPYHLTKAGVDVRTQLLIDDLQKILVQESKPIDDPIGAN